VKGQHTAGAITSIHHIIDGEEKGSCSAASEGERQRGVAVEKKKFLAAKITCYTVASETILQVGESRESCGSSIDGCYDSEGVITFILHADTRMHDRPPRTNRVSCRHKSE
jgi:hypothetical protein